MLPLVMRSPPVQRLRRLIARSSARRIEERFVIEGSLLLNEARTAGWSVEAVYGDGDGNDDSDGRLALAPGLLERISDCVTPQGPLAVVERRTAPLESLREATFVVVLVDVRDPGNAGTILRSAEAAGADGLVACDGCVDIFAPKTVRASAGALFHVPIVAGGDPAEVLAALAGFGIVTLATDAHTGTSYTAADLTRRIAVILGNEANGLDSTVMVDEYITIAQMGRTESLNVSMAAVVIAFEAARQRRDAAS